MKTLFIYFAVAPKMEQNEFVKETDLSYDDFMKRVKNEND